MNSSGCTLKWRCPVEVIGLALLSEAALQVADYCHWVHPLLIAGPVAKHSVRDHECAHGDSLRYLPSIKNRSILFANERMALWCPMLSKAGISL